MCVCVCMFCWIALKWCRSEWIICEEPTQESCTLQPVKVKTSNKEQLNGTHRDRDHTTYVLQSNRWRKTERDREKGKCIYMELNRNVWQQSAFNTISIYVYTKSKRRNNFRWSAFVDCITRKHEHKPNVIVILNSDTNFFGDNFFFLFSFILITITKSKWMGLNVCASNLI